MVVELVEADNYGARDVLIDCASDYLPEPFIRSMISAFQKMALAHKDHKRHYFMTQVESLARQLGDAELFEQTRVASWRKPDSSAFLDIAHVYFESGDPETARAWLEKIPDTEITSAHKRDQLLRKVYDKFGQREHVADLLYRQFNEYRTADNLAMLLDEIGHENREKIIRQAVEAIHLDQEYHQSDLDFLVSLDNIEDAEAYILNRARQINGYEYWSLVPIAENMENGQCFLASSLIYRALLVSILERGKTKAYTSGISHLKKLDQQADIIEDWQTFDDHETFKTRIRQHHGRKRTFWAKYDV